MVDASLQHDIALRHDRRVEMEREFAIVEPEHAHPAPIKLREQQLLLDPDAGHEDANGQRPIRSYGVVHE